MTLGLEPLGSTIDIIDVLAIFAATFMGATLGVAAGLKIMLPTVRKAFEILTENERAN